MRAARRNLSTPPVTTDKVSSNPIEIMRKQVINIFILQSSKILTILYALMGFIYTLIGIPMAIFGHGPVRVMGIVYLFGPVFMAIFGFIFFVIFAAIYNILAKSVGGIEVEIKSVGQPSGV
jgi:hypothetical protein